MNATTVAVDLAKSVFQLAVADASWKVVETHRQIQFPIPRCDEIDRSLMATRFAPSHIDADNSSGCLPAVCIDWHWVSRFPCPHGPMRAHYRCRIYDCTRFPKAKTVGQSLAVVGESI